MFAIRALAVSVALAGAPHMLHQTITLKPGNYETTATMEPSVSRPKKILGSL